MAKVTLTQWFRRLVSGQPHFTIGNPDNPYMLRWYLIPRNRWFNVYLHKFLRDDDDRALHDHPWWFVSVMLKGMYNEILERGHAGYVRSAPSVAYRQATHRHRVVLERDECGKVVPCWTLIFTGPKVREWGFWCNRGWIPWQEFCKAEQPGQIGIGCGDES